MVTTLQIQARALRKNKSVKVYIDLSTVKVFCINSTLCLQFYLRGYKYGLVGKYLSRMMETLGLIPIPREGGREGRMERERGKKVICRNYERSTFILSVC